MGRTRKYEYHPSPPPPREFRRMCRVKASGIIHVSYIGLCGQRSGFEEKVTMYESWRIWKTDGVAEFISRFVRMAREKSIWPQWVPPQEPIFEVYDYLQEV